MMRAPDLATISAAELKVAQSLRSTRDGLSRVRFAFRAALARPVTLALVAGAAGFIVFWLVRRPRARATPVSHGVTATTSAAGLALAFIARYAMLRIPHLLQNVWAAWQERAARRGPDMPESPATDYSTTGVRH